MVARRVVLMASALLSMGLCTAPACCVEPPRARDLLSVGFRTPEQTFATFQTAVRAADPAWQRRCFSAQFIARNGLSELAFRESWERMEKEEPFLRKGLVDARLLGRGEVRGPRARLSAGSHGRRIEIDLVREDFCEAWEGGAKVADEGAPFPERSGVQAGTDGATWFYGRMPLPSGLDPGRVTELRVGREWKIDGFEVVEGKAKKAPARAESEAADDLP